MTRHAPRATRRLSDGRIDAIAHFASETLQITPLKGVFGPAMAEYVIGWLLAIERNVISHEMISRSPLLSLAVSVTLISHHLENFNPSP